MDQVTGAGVRLRIEVDLYSGRPNPAVTLDEQRSAELLGRLRPAGRLADAATVSEPVYLGYRGLLVEVLGERVEELPSRFRLLRGAMLGPGLAHRVRDERVEVDLLSADGPLAQLELGSEFFGYLGREYVRAGELIPWPWWRWHPEPWFNPCACAPIYEPGWWNVPARQPFNNCYNYASNYRSDTYAQPGLAAGAKFSSYTCASVIPAAVADELIDDGGADNACPSSGHLVALVMAPGWDFHWYRKGPDGYWSHKPGGTPVTNIDNSGNPIPDPRTADRGPYVDFCTFMIVMDGHIKIA